MDNTAPTLDISISLSLPNVEEDAPPPSGAVGVLVSSLVDLDSVPGGLDNVTDPDPDATTGIAVVNQDGAVACHYSLDGGTTWFTIGLVGSDVARLLAADADNRIYCRAVPDQYGEWTEAFAFVAWDQSSGTDGGVGNAFLRGGTTAFSTEIEHPSLNVDAINDAPQATNLSAAETYLADTPRNLTDIVVTDVDNETTTATLTLSDSTAGALSTGTSGTTTSTYDEATGAWSAEGPIGEVNALLASVTFTPAPGYASDFTIATEISDGTDSSSGNKAVSFTNPPVVPVLSIADASVAEGNSGTKLLTFTLSLSEETSGPVSVHATTSDRTAKAGSDYTARDLTVSFAAGQTSRTVTVPVLGDTVVELPERLAVALSVPNGATLGDSVALGTIGNDDRGLRVLTPNGGERWARGTKHRISWLWGRLSGRITIQLVRSGTVVRQITGKAALGTNGRGHFTWTVPSGITPARGYKIRLVSNKRPAFKDSSDRGFRITRG